MLFITNFGLPVGNWGTDDGSDKTRGTGAGTGATGTGNTGGTGTGAGVGGTTGPGPTGNPEQKTPVTRPGVVKPKGNESKGLTTPPTSTTTVVDGCISERFDAKTASPQVQKADAAVEQTRKDYEAGYQEFLTALSQIEPISGTINQSEREAALTAAFNEAALAISGGTTYQASATTMAALTKAFGASMAKAYTSLLRLQSLATQHAAAENARDFAAGVFPKEKLTENLLTRMQLTADDFNDRFGALLGPAKMFEGVSGECMQRLNAAMGKAMTDRTNTAGTQMGGVPVSGSTGITFKLSSTTGTGDFTLTNPGLTVAAVTDWQQAGIVAVGETQTVMDWIANGVPKGPTGAPTTMQEAVEKWRGDQQILAMTPSVATRVAKLADLQVAANNGDANAAKVIAGLPEGARKLLANVKTPADLFAALKADGGALNKLFEALAIKPTRPNAPVGDVNVQTQSKGVEGGVTTTGDGGTMGGVQYKVGPKTSQTTRISISNYRREVDVQQPKKKGVEFSIGGGAKTGPKVTGLGPGTSGPGFQVGIKITF